MTIISSAVEVEATRISMNLTLHMKTSISHVFTPTRMFVLSFAAVILTGGILLWSPLSAAKDTLRFVDSLFIFAPVDSLLDRSCNIRVNGQQAP
jgi:hypothetical protein